MTSLYKHQKEIISMSDLSEEQLLIVNDTRDNLFVALNTGVGKTISTLYAISYKYPSANILVVVPKTLRDDKSWEQDLDKIEVSLNMKVLSKEDFKRDYMKLEKFDVLVIDEACDWLLSGLHTNLRSSNRVKYIDTSGIYDAVERYIYNTKPKHIYMLDATPMSNKPLHVFAAKWLFGFIQGDKITSHQDFIKRFYNAIPKGYTHIYIEKTKKNRFTSEEEVETKQEELKSLWKEIAIFADDKRKIKPIEEDILVEADEKHKELISSVKRNFTDPLARRARLFFIENGHYRDIKFDDVLHTQEMYKQAIPTMKEKKIAKFILDRNPSNGAIIFATPAMQQVSIKDELDKLGITSEIVNGESKDRSNSFNLFREGKIKVLIIQSSMCVGYNMPNCDCVIRASPPVRASHLDQQYGRIDRASNYKQNYVFNFILKGGVDEKSFNQVKEGQDLQFLSYE